MSSHENFFFIGNFVKEKKIQRKFLPECCLEQIYFDNFNMASDGITEVDANLIETNYDNVVYSFDDLNLKRAILRGESR